MFEPAPGAPCGDGKERFSAWERRVYAGCMGENKRPGWADHPGREWMGRRRSASPYFTASIETFPPTTVTLASTPCCLSCEEIASVSAASLMESELGTSTLAALPFNVTSSARDVAPLILRFCILTAIPSPPAS